MGQSKCDLEKGEATLYERRKRLALPILAATFVVPQYVPMDEQHRQVQINPYGMTKWVTERILQDYDAPYGMHSVALRYFNAAGAAPDAALS